MMWLFANIRTVGILAAFLTSFSLGWHVHSRIAEHTLKSALASQQEALQKQCQDNVKITQEASDAYQKNLTAANSKLAEYRRLYAHTRLPIASKANGLDAGAANCVNTGQNGVDATALLDLGGECEQYRQQIIGLQGFINRVWQP